MKLNNNSLKISVLIYVLYWMCNEEELSDNQYIHLETEKDRGLRKTFKENFTLTWISITCDSRGYISPRAKGSNWKER